MKIDFCECPICHQMTMTTVPPSTGNSYMISEVDTSVNPPKIIPTSGVPVKLMCCTSCKTVLPRFESFDVKRS